MFGNGGVENAACHIGDGLVFITGLTYARHRGRRSHAKKMLSIQLGAKTAHEHGYVSALPTTICVQLIKDEKFKPLAVLHHDLVARMPRENEVEHHVVRKEDVRRILTDLLAFILALLARVATYRNGLFAFGIIAEELAHLLALAVRKRVHWIDDDGTSFGRRIRLLLLDNAVDDRDEEAERLARPRARRDHIALAMLDMGDRLPLMLVEMEGLLRESGNTILHLLLEKLEDRGTFRSQHASSGQVIDCLVLLIVRVDLNKGLSPVAPTVVFLF